MNKKVIIVITVLVAIITLTIVGTKILRENNKIILQGSVVVTETKISSKLPGRVEGLVFREGDNVELGDFLFAISTPEVDAKLIQAEAARSAAEAQKMKADAGTRKQILQSAYNLWKKAQYAVAFAQKSYDRIENLYVDKVIPEQKRDEVKVKLDVAIESEKIAHDQYKLAKQGAQKEDKMTANALVQKAQGAVDEIEAYLADASQYAPYTGEISTIIAQNGELASTGYPVITMIDVEKAWIAFNVKETLLPQIIINSEIEVNVPALDKNLTLKIQSIAVQAEYATWVSTDARGGFDIRTFEVRAYPVLKNTGLRPGMSVLYELK